MNASPTLIADAFRAQVYEKFYAWSDHLARASSSWSLEEWDQFVRLHFMNEKSVTNPFIFGFTASDQSRRQFGKVTEYYFHSVELLYHQLPRFFFTHFIANVRSLRLVIEVARVSQMTGISNAFILDAPRLTWTLQLVQGTRVIHEGAMRLIYQLEGNQWRISQWHLFCMKHDTFIPKVIVSQSDESWTDHFKAINAFGVPEDVMRCLEIADTVLAMVPLMKT